MLINDCARIRGHKHIDKNYFTMVYFFNLSHKYSTMVHKNVTMSDKVCVVFADVYQNAQNDPTGRPTPLPEVPGFSSRTLFNTIIVNCML